MTETARTSFQLRLPVLAGSLVLFAATGMLIHLWHVQQIPQIAAAYEARGAHLAAQGQWETAAYCLERCLDLAPTRITAIIRLAEVSKQLATTDGKKAAAVGIHYRAVGLAPEQLQIRLDLSELESELGNYAQAEHQARHVLEQLPGNRDALRLVALACYHQFIAGEPKAEELVSDGMQQALQANPGDTVLAQALATLYREHARELDRSRCVELADRVMNDLVAGQPDRATPFLCRHEYRKKYNLPNAFDDLERALDLDSSDVNVRRALAEHEFERENWPTALALFAELVKKTKQPEAFWRLGQCYAAVGEPESAVSMWEAGLTRDSESVELHLELARWFILQEQSERATPFLDVLDDLVPTHLSIDQIDSNSAFWLEKELLRARWRLCNASTLKSIELLRTMIGRSPRPEDMGSRETLLESWHLLGRAHQELRQWDQTVHAFVMAAELEPSSIKRKLLVVGALADAGGNTEAIHYCQQALLEFPDAAELWLALAEIQLHQQRYLVRPDRDLELVHAALDRTQEIAASDGRIPIYRADTWVLAESSTLRNKALEHLRAAESHHPRDTQFWRELVSRYEILEDADGVERALAHLSSVTPDPSVLSLTRAQLHMDRGDLDKARNEIQLLMKTEEKETRQTAQELLIRLELQAGHFQDAHAHLLARRADRPRDMGVVWELGKLAIGMRDWEEVREWEFELRELEGEFGCHWRWLKACSLLAQLDGDDDQRLLEVMRLQEYIGAQSPEWPLSNLLEGRVCERRANLDEAIVSYTAAVTGGVDEPLAYDRLIQLLCQRGEVDLARLYWEQAQRVLPRSLERAAVVEQGETRISDSNRRSLAHPTGDTASLHIPRKKLPSQRQ